MDLQSLLKTKHHDPLWLTHYLTFITETPKPGEGALADAHHILPKSAFPDFASLDDNPWNRVDLAPADHLLAHYYLFRALPGEPSVRQAFKMMVGFRFKEVQRSCYDEALVREIAAAYESARGLGKPWSEKARLKRSDNMKGKPVHAGLTRLGAVLSEETKQKMTEARVQFYTTNPEGVAALDAARPRGEAHAFFGQERPADVRTKIAASNTGKVHADITRLKMSATHGQQSYDAIPAEEHEIYTQALRLDTEVDAIIQRRAFATNSRQYLILTGLMHIRLNRTDVVDPKYWQQAANWLVLSGRNSAELPGLTPRSATTRLGTGHTLLPGQVSAHDLRKVGVAKGVTQARQAFDGIPADERTTLASAWEVAATQKATSALVAERKLWPVRGRAYNILFGMQWIREGKATPETFERWRQAAIFLRLSGRDCPIGPEATKELDRVAPF